AIARGAFGDIRRSIDGGKGADGVIERAPDYVNPILDALEADAPAIALPLERPRLREVP
ncbi:MAG: hypothetical protein D6689_09570, partial [Deltaproteobacteria bacterium]